MKNTSKMRQLLVVVGFMKTFSKRYGARYYDGDTVELC